MELKEGMYVRTHRGIARIVEKPNISVVVWNDRKVIYVDKNGCPIPASLSFYVFEDEITASSFNIIDVIEIGDYVNGKQVIQKYKDWLDLDDDTADLKDIKNIVTKEQFEACKYVVERNK